MPVPCEQTSKSYAAILHIVFVVLFYNACLHAQPIQQGSAAGSGGSTKAASGFASVASGEQSNPSIAAATERNPLPLIPSKITTAPTAVFIENVGQFDPKVLYQVKIGAQTAWLTNGGIVFDATRPTKMEQQSSAPADNLSGLKGIITQSGQPDKVRQESPTFDRLAFSENFVGSACCSRVEAKGANQGVYNYFQDRDSSKWRRNVRGYSEVVYHDIWPGIGLRVYGKGQDLEQEFIVEPGGNLNQIQVSFQGVEDVKILEDGSLEVVTAFGKLRETKPLIYQQIDGARMLVEGRFKLTSDKAYTFDVEAYDASHALVIDPTLLYSTFLGGSAGNNVYGTNAEVATGIAVDASGSAYITGYTQSLDFPTTPGTLQPGTVSGRRGAGTAFITKLNPTGSDIVYSTYLGVSTRAQAIALDGTGQVYVTGYITDTGSAFPTTPNAFSPTDAQHHCGDADFFVTAFNSTGDHLVYSTCIGGDAGNWWNYGYYLRRQNSVG